MLVKMNQKCIGQWTLFLIFSLFSLCLTPVVTGETKGGDSPLAVFKIAQVAGAKKDFSTLVKLVAPTEHPMMAFGTAMGLGMFVEFYEGENAAELKKKFQEIEKKYAIKEDDGKKLKITQDTPQEVIDEHMRKRAEKQYGHVDASKYVPDVMGIVLNLPEMADQTFIPQEKLTDLKINENRATGKAGKKKISFIREGGRWYLTADIMN